MFSIWLQKIKLPSRSLPMFSNHLPYMNHVYLRTFDPEQEEQQLKDLAVLGWKKVEGILYTGLAIDEGMAPIYGSIEEGSLIEIQKIEDLQP